MFQNPLKPRLKHQKNFPVMLKTAKSIVRQLKKHFEPTWASDHSLEYYDSVINCDQTSSRPSLNSEGHSDNEFPKENCFI